MKKKMSMDYLLSKFEYLECPECKRQFAMKWDIFPHVYCPKCKASIELSKNRIEKPIDDLKTKLKEIFYFEKLMSKLIR